MAQEAEAKGSDPFGPRLPVHQHGLGVIPERPQSGTLDQPDPPLGNMLKHPKLFGDGHADVAAICRRIQVALDCAKT
jgi:hypothetical protein